MPETAAEADFVTSTGDMEESYVTCSGAGEFVASGGGGWDAGGHVGPKTTDHLVSDSVTGDGTQWYVSGRNNNSSFTAYWETVHQCISG